MDNSDNEHHISYLPSFHLFCCENDGLLEPPIRTAHPKQRQDPSQNFSSMEELWGPDLAKTTLRQLLGMQCLATGGAGVMLKG